MATTATDLKDALITQFDALIAVITSVDNLHETFNKGFKNYEITVNNTIRGGKDAIGIRDNFVTGDPRRYTIYIRIASQQLPYEKAIIAEAVLTSGEFATQETAFTDLLETLRDKIYADSVTMVNTIGADMVSRLS